MATVSILRPRATAGAAIERDGVRMFQFDATLREQHSRTAVVTSHPVEEGADVADNVRVENPKLTLVGITSNTPFDEAVSLPSRDFVAWETLAQLLDDGQPLRIVTPLEVYSDMVFVGLQCERSRETGQAIAPTLSFERMRFAESFTVSIPPEVIVASAAVEAGPGGSGEDDGGRGTTSDAEGADAEVAESWASQGAGALGSLFGGG